MLPHIFKPKNKEEFIKREREYDEEKRRKFLAELEKQKEQEKKDAEPSVPFKQRFVAGARAAGSGIRGGLKKAAQYKMSPETKAKIKRHLESIQDEFEETSNYYKPAKRSKRSYVEEQRDDFASMFDFSEFRGYASQFDPFKQQTSVGRKKKQAIDYDGYDYQAYLDAFNPFKR